MMNWKIYSMNLQYLKEFIVEVEVEVELQIGTKALYFLLNEQFLV